MQRIRTVITALQVPPAFGPKGGTAFQHQYRGDSAAGNGAGDSRQAILEAATKGTYGSLASEGFGASCRETQPGGAKMRFEESIVHIVRDDPVGTKQLTEFLVSKGLGVAAFRTAAEYMAARRDDRPTCLILDLSLPDLHALDIHSRLADEAAPPFVFVASHGDPVSVVRAMKNGAIDFLIEPIDYLQLMTAVELALVADMEKRNERIERASLLARWRSLTPRETEVFHYTVAGLLNKQAAAELGVVENTYQVHRGRVMRKMNARSLADLVRMSTKLEPFLPQPCQRRICYGATVVVPRKTAEYEAHPRLNMSTCRKSAEEAGMRTGTLSGLEDTTSIKHGIFSIE
jgi:FixJ family two-component response regulator